MRWRLPLHGYRSACSACRRRHAGRTASVPARSLAPGETVPARPRNGSVSHRRYGPRPGSPAPRWRRFPAQTQHHLQSWSRLLCQTKRSSPLLVPLFMFIDSNCLNDLFRFRPGQIDRQQPVFQVRTQHLHPLRQHESALEVARGDAAMDVLPGLVVVLAAPDHELVFLNSYIELVAGKTRHRQRDPQPFGLAVGAVAPLDIIGRVTVGALDDAIERTLDFVESKQERAG